MAREGRGVVIALFKTFIESLKPRQITGNLMGKDNFGNKYYEIPLNPNSRKTRPARWFEPEDKENFEQEMPAEWESWLRGRRKEPPTEEEVAKNLTIMQLKKKNAAEVAAKTPKPSGVLKKDIKGMESFPQYPEYEVNPGKLKNK